MHDPTNRAHRGFTLVEMLIAMALTLLLMAALGKAFGIIGKTMKDGRSQVTLSSKLRGISFRLRTDLRARTVEAKPPIRSDSGRGYITYYEGPLTEHTWGLYGAEPYRITDNGDVLLSTDPRDIIPPSGNSIPDYDELPKSPSYRRHARFGDIDDYIAFTAEAPGNEWYTGKVPRYLVHDNPPPANPFHDPNYDPMDPVVIRSKFAEIIIWASPRWAVDPDTNDLITAGTTQGMPRYVDDNNDLIPDQVDLHHRVLLIRPDLNASGTIPDPLLNFDSDYLRPIDGTGAPDNVPTELQRIYPIQDQVPAMPFYSTYVDSNSSTNPSAMLRSHWLVGMAPVHHFFDLSLRRIVNPVTGEPTGFVAANSLNDLVQPHNRFAHVRYPGRYFGRGSFTNNYDAATSMPLLALAWNDSILTWNTNDPREPASVAAPTWFPTANPFPNTINTNTSIQTPIFNGWLLPHFALGDPNSRPTLPNLPDTDQWLRGYLVNGDPPDSRWDRTGEDIIASNILSFDIKGYDGNAPVFITSGVDGQPGQAGVNDDGIPTSGANMTDLTYVPPNPLPPNAEIHTELGTIGSDDVIVRVGDLGIAPLIQEPIFDPRDANLYHAGLYNAGPVKPTHQQMLVSKGDFVDLMFPYLAGGAMKNLVVSKPGSVSTNLGAFFASDLSGYPPGNPQLTRPTLPNTDAPISPLRRSGKMVYYGTTGAEAFLQPCFDTWTDGYELDGFDQTSTLTGIIDDYPSRYGSVWVLNDPAASGGQPRLPVPRPPIIARSAPPQPFSVDTGRYDPAEPESSPPFAGALPAISITIRVSDPATGKISEMTTVQKLIN